MQLTAVVFLSLITCLPGLSQMREVTVEQAKIVQVSSSEDSPNITQVTGNVNVIIYKCTNVTYCGPNYVGGHIDDSLYVPVTKPTPMTFMGTGRDNDGTTGFNSSFAGVLPSLTDSSRIASSGTTSDLFGTQSDATQTGAFTGVNLLSGAYEKPQTGGVGLPLADGTTLIPTSNSPLANFFSASPYGINGPLGQDHDASIFALDNDPAVGHLGEINSESSGVAGSPSMEYGARSLGEKLAAWIPKGTNSSLGVEELDIQSLVGTGSGLAKTLSQSVDNGPLSDSSLIGGVPGYPQYLRVASYSSSDKSFETDTGLNLFKLHSNLATGFDQDSLMRHLEDLTKTSKKIVGWTIFTEEDQAIN